MSYTRVRNNVSVNSELELLHFRNNMPGPEPGALPIFFSGRCADSLLTEIGLLAIGIRAEITAPRTGNLRPDYYAPR
jgi:hypothetical protein